MNIGVIFATPNNLKITQAGELKIENECMCSTMKVAFQTWKATPSVNVAMVWFRRLFILTPEIDGGWPEFADF